MARNVEECEGCSIKGNFGISFDEIYTESECQDELRGIFNLTFDKCELSLRRTLKSYYYDTTYKFKETVQYKVNACFGTDYCVSEESICGLENWGDYDYEDCELGLELSGDKCRQTIGDKIDCQNFIFGGDPCDIENPRVESFSTAFEDSCKELYYYDGTELEIRQTRGNPASILAVSLAALVSATAVLQY